MPGGWDSYGQAVAADGPVAWYRFQELLSGSTIAAGSQNPQNLCFDSSFNGNCNQSTPAFPNGNYLQYGSGVLSNQPSLLTTSGSTATPFSGDPGGSAIFPSTVTTSTANIITSGAVQPAILQPSASVTVEAWHKPNVCTTGSVKQVIACYGSDASSLAAYNLYHSGSSAVNHTFKFSVNIGGSLTTATATVPVVTVGTVYHVVGVYDGVAVRVYVNGVSGGTSAVTGAISYASLGSYGLAFGNDGSLSDANLQGYVDEIAIYAQPLSATRIAYHYRQGSVYLPFVWNH